MLKDFVVLKSIWEKTFLRRTFFQLKTSIIKEHSEANHQYYFNRTRRPWETLYDLLLKWMRRRVVSTGFDFHLWSIYEEQKIKKKIVLIYWKTKNFF